MKGSLNIRDFDCVLLAELKLAAAENKQTLREYVIDVLRWGRAIGVEDERSESRKGL